MFSSSLSSDGCLFTLETAAVHILPCVFVAGCCRFDFIPCFHAHDSHREECVSCMLSCICFSDYYPENETNMSNLDRQTTSSLTDETFQKISSQIKFRRYFLLLYILIFHPLYAINQNIANIKVLLISRSTFLLKFHNTPL